MSDFWKKTLLYLLMIVIVLFVLLVRNTDNSIDAAKSIDAANKATCLNGYNALAAAQFQKKMLDQQVLLSAARGNGEEAMTVGVQVSELKGIITVLEKLVADKALNCPQYKEST